MLDKRVAPLTDEAAKFNNEQWQTMLRQRPDLKYCQFPAETEIVIGGTLAQATITMIDRPNKGLHANMQSDSAAFDAWALALLFHCGAQEVHIGLGPGVRVDCESLRHYERFLYRLRRFADLFRDRVKITNWPAAGSKALDPQIKRLLNRPNSRKNPPQTERDERMKAASAPAPSESDLEKALEVSGAFREHFHLTKVMRQWPTGLFNGSVGEGHQVFTGGKSGIDLIGIQDDTLVLFELKKAGNRKAGAVSELLFYASVMRDALGDSPTFEFESKKAIKNCEITPKDITSCSKIRGVLLAPGFHPFFEEASIFKELNGAMKQLYVDRPVQFETARIVDYPQDEWGDFKFSNG